MVKLLAALVAVYRVLVLEVVAVTLICVGLGVRFGAWTVYLALGVAALVKAFELDLTDEGDGDR